MRWTIGTPEPVRPVAARFDLPFCLHLQNGSYTVVVDGRTVEVVLQKVWRNSENCSDDDQVYEDAIRFPTGTVTSGKMGGDPDEARRRIGTNVEIQEDPDGEFRFSRVTVGLLARAEGEPDLHQLLDQALVVINRVVDVFRFVSKRAYLPPVRTNDIRFVEWVWPLTEEFFFQGRFGKGIEIAVVNESSGVHDEVRAMLESDLDVPLQWELLMAAKRLLDGSTTRQAVVEAVSALQVLVESVLRRGVDVGVFTEDEFEVVREESLSDLMKRPFRKVLSWSPADESDLWNSWLTANQTRRLVVHRGHKLDLAEAETAVGAVESLMSAIEARI